MSIFLSPQQVCDACGQLWYPSDGVEKLHCPNCGGTQVHHERFSLYVTFMFYTAGLAALIWIATHWKDIVLPPVVTPTVDVVETLTKSEQQVALPSIEEELDIHTEPALVTPPKVLAKATAQAPSLEAESLPPPVQVTETVVEARPEIVAIETPVIEPTVNNSALAFSQWSVSELRLRSEYTKLMNDGSSAADVRKKEYLQYVNSRNKKCGELNAQFAKNINAVGSLTFKEGDSATLECHSAENSSELNRLKLMGYDG